MPATTKQRKAKQLAALKYQRRIQESNGTIKVSFCFAGKEFVQSHKLSAAEMDLQKQLLEKSGAGAFDAASLRMSIWGAGKLGEHTVTEAFKEYARKFYDPSLGVNAINMNKELDDEHQQVADDSGKSVNNG